jgi:ABC-2 type transport system ATP-binding protein
MMRTRPDVGTSAKTANALETENLSKRYGGTWALRDCALTIPTGRVAALVGPNGAGKTTLLHLAVGLLQPTAGEVRVCGISPRERPKEALPRVGFVAQDHPLYRGFRVSEMLTLGRKLNPRWDDTVARARLERLGIPLDRPIGKLSGGQQAQVSLALVVAKRPELILLDEPLASLDPLARREFLRALVDAATEDGLTVLLSSHIIGDLERVCDYLVILAAARVQLAGDIEEIRSTHRALIGPAVEAERIAGMFSVIGENPSGRSATLLVRGADAAPPPGWEAREATLEEIVLAYLERAAFGGREAPATSMSVRASGEEVAR